MTLFVTKKAMSCNKKQSKPFHAQCSGGEGSKITLLHLFKPVLTNSSRISSTVVINNVNNLSLPFTTKEKNTSSSDKIRLILNNTNDIKFDDEDFSVSTIEMANNNTNLIIVEDSTIQKTKNKILVENSLQKHSKKKKKNIQVNFSNNIKIYNIPSRYDYNVDELNLIWYNTNELQNMVWKNTLEYNWEQGNWRLAIEEDKFCYYNSIKIHPAHVPYTNNNYNYQRNSSIGSGSSNSNNNNKNNEGQNIKLSTQNALTKKK